MRWAWVLAGVGVLACLFVLFVPGASANAPFASNGLCSQAVAPNIVAGVDLGDTYLVVKPSSGDPSVACSTSEPFVDDGFGVTLTLTCAANTDTTGPGAPTSQTIKGVADNSGFGTASPTAIWTFTPPGACTAGVTTWTERCTSDGTATGAPWYGVVRIHVRMTRVVGITTVYDVNSETDPGSPSTRSPAVGVYRCDPRVTQLDMGAAPSNPWIGGDAVPIRTSVSSTSEISQTTGFQRLICGTSPNHDAAAVQFGTSTSTATTTIIGPPNDFQTGCTLKAQAILNRKSAISLYSTLDYARWDQTSPPAGVTFPNSLTAEFSGNTLNRILSPSGSCGVTVSGTTTTVVNRGEVAHITGCSPWNDARGSNVPNNQPATGFVQRLAQWQVLTDFGRFDGLFASSGAFPTDNTATTSATVTTGLAYRKMVLEYSTTARTDAVLLNWGNSSQLLDVSATITFGTCAPSGCANGVLNSKTVLGANASAFVISADTEHVSTRASRDQAGNLLSGVTVSCFRTRPDLVVESAQAMGTTDASGNTADHTFTVAAPAGRWTLQCDESLNGNSGTYVIQFFFTSAFTADKSIPVLWNVTQLSNGSALANVTMGFWLYDVGAAPASDSMICAFADDVVRLTVRVYDPATNDYSSLAVSRQIMAPQVNPGGTLNCDWSYQFFIPAANLSRGAWAFTTFNFTGAPFVGTEAFTLQSQTVSTMTAITTQLDPYLPLLIWGGLMFLLLWLEAVAPAFIAFLNMMDSQLPVPVMNAQARIMLFGLVLLVHSFSKMAWKRLHQTREEAKEG